MQDEFTNVLQSEIRLVLVPFVLWTKMCQEPMLQALPTTTL